MPSLQQHINKIAEIFFRCGGTVAVISPGSRNAPIIVAFVRHKKIQCIPITDERSAGFIALGIAQQSKKPVAVICTSGTAVANLYPAVCEAFYQNIPLVVITADRPPELIDQWDGQAIRQNDIFKNHILKSISIPDTGVENSIELIESGVKEIIISAIQQKLPVHINVPLREPFYPDATEKYIYSEEKIEIVEASLLPIHKSEKDVFEIEKEIGELKESNPSKILVLLGMNDFDGVMMEKIHSCCQKLNIPVIADIISNYNFESISNYDWILDLNHKNAEILKPDILLTLGGAMLSKNLRNYFRKNKPTKQFHIQAIGHVGDPFQSLAKIIRTEPGLFFERLSETGINTISYFDLWKREDEKVEQAKNNQELPFSELKAAKIIFNSLPDNFNIQLSNSMPVRYAMMFGKSTASKFNSNRGTSGIDGCSSTAVGAALATQYPTLLFTGDLAFFYDVNAFWNKIELSNLRIIILNNGGGGIFRLIEGPSGLNELEEFIEQAQTRTAEHVATDFKMEYMAIKNETELNESLKDFYSKGNQAKIMEVFTDKLINTKAYKEFKNAMLA